MHLIPKALHSIVKCSLSYTMFAANTSIFIFLHIMPILEFLKVTLQKVWVADLAEVIVLLDTCVIFRVFCRLGTQT